MKCNKCGKTHWVKWGTNPNGQQRFQCKGCGYRPWSMHIKPDAGIPKAAVRALHKRLVSARGVQRYVITAAQNATPVNQEFLDALLTLCRERKAQLLVIPYRYKNPTSIWSGAAQEDDWWAAELVPYLYDRRRALNKNLLLLGDIKTQPTASRPLEGFESISGPFSAIIGHPKLELTTVPTPQNRLPKILTTTGAVTARNYIPSKAGKRGEFHHTFGAAYVEVKGSKFHLRQLNAVKDGSFIDLGWEYRSNAEPKWVGVSGIVLGDTHFEFASPSVTKATFGPQGIVTALRPKTVAWHDVHDFYSRMHWHIGQPFIDFVKHHTGTDDVEKALKATFDYVDQRTRPGTTNVFVGSNHPDMFQRWVKRADWRTDPVNAKFLLKTALAMLEGSKMGKGGVETIDPFYYWAARMLKTARQAVFLAPDQHYQVEGIELGYHGHNGPNGARGTRGSFTKIGVKVIIGHTHSPGIAEGVYQVGTSSELGLEFAHGPSSWLNTHCLIYPNGKRSLINIIEGEWRA